MTDVTAAHRYLDGRTTMKAVPCAVVLAAVLSTPAAAQDVTVESSTSLRLFGAVGRAVSVGARLTGSDINAPTRGTTYVSGKKMRTDSGSQSMLVDLVAGRLTVIDHTEKTYVSQTFEEMAAAMRSAGESARDRREPQSSEAKGEVQLRYTAAVDRTGEKATIAGVDAERVLMTITMTVDAAPQGERQQEVGSMVVLMDEWVSSSASHASAIREFEKAYAERVGQELRNNAAGLEAAFAANPQMREGLAAAAKERQKIQGLSLRSATYVALVPAGTAFDRQLVLDEGAAPPPPAAEGRGGLRGMLGGLRKMAEEADKGRAQAAPKQATLMAIKGEVTGVESGRVDQALFAVPSGYRQATRR